MNILIPMAGLGTRFLNAGYKNPKPLIKFLNKTMIEHVIDSINIEGKYIFIVQEEHIKKYQIDLLLKKIIKDCTVLSINKQTSGAAETTLFAKKNINNKEQLIIANSDQIVKWDSKAFISKLNKGDGCIAVFKDTDPKWSFADINNDLVIRVAEKKQISNNATVGIYGWNFGSDYVKYAEQMIKKNIRTNNEFYVCPVYNEAILDGKKIVPFSVEQMYGVGTPEDLERFLNA